MISTFSKIFPKSKGGASAFSCYPLRTPMIRLVQNSALLHKAR